MVLQQRGFAAARLALFAVNNNPDVEQAGGGSHWSLLAYAAADNAFRHFDSMAGTNRQAARRVYEAAAAAAPPGARYVEQPAPQQANGYDCGVYVLALAQLLCARLAAAASSGGKGMSFEVGGLALGMRSTLSNRRAGSPSLSCSLRAHQAVLQPI